MRAEPRDALSTQPAQTRPGHPLPLMALNKKRPAEASLRESAKSVIAARRSLRIRADQSPSLLGERTPRIESGLTAGRCLGLAHWYCGHASHEILQWPVNRIVVEHNVLDNAFSAIGIEPVDVGNQTFSAPVGINRFRNHAGF